MTAIEVTETPLSEEIQALQEKINQLETEVASRQRDIENLREAIATIEAGEPRPPRPEVDNLFNLLQEMIGQVPQQLEKRQLYAAKFEAAKDSLALAIETCQHKSSTLKLLNAELRQKLAEQLFQELTEQARKFNENADENFELLEKMKELKNQITRLRGGTTHLTIYGEEREALGCNISASSVIVQRRVDVPRS